MNIFFVGSIRGGRAQLPDYQAIVGALQRHGTVLPQYISDEALSDYGETNLPATEILSRELDKLEKCDVVVADVTTPSLGVGYLIARATVQQKKVVALYRGTDALKLSAIIKGDSHISVYTYQEKTDIDSVLDGALRSLTP